MVIIKFNKKRILIVLAIVILLIIVIIPCTIFIPKAFKKNVSQFKPSLMLGGQFQKRACIGKNCTDYKYPLSENGAKKSGISEESVKAAARMLSWMDRSVDPCVDFYNFSCGNFIRSHALPEGSESYSAFDVGYEKIDLTIKTILEYPFHLNDSDALKKAKHVYKSCMDLTRIEKESKQDLKNVLSNGFVGEWPFLKPKWKDCRLDIEWRTAKLNALGMDSLFGIEFFLLGKDYKPQVGLKLASPLVKGICDEEYDNVTLMIKERAPGVKKSLDSVLKVMGVKVTNVTEQDIEELFEFDYLFCNIAKASEQQIYISLGNVTLSKLADLSPQFNWFRWRSILLSELRINVPHGKIEIYADRLESSVVEINELLQNTTSKVLANYLTFKFILQSLGYLGKTFRQIQDGYTGNSKLGLGQIFSHRWQPRWRQCVQFIRHAMPYSVLKEYRYMTYDEEIDRAVWDIGVRIKNEFRTIMRDSRDLLENDRIKSYDKIDKVNLLITYPGKNDSYLDKYYLDMFQTTERSFLLNGMRAMSASLRKKFESSSKNMSAHQLEYMYEFNQPLEINAYSEFIHNRIIINVADLQHFPLSPKFPKYLSMSMFGSLIAHELSHGFDLRSFISNNPMQDELWMRWPRYMRELVVKKAHCFLEFFPHPKNLTLIQMLESDWLNEDLCDHQAIYLSYKAYMRYLSKISPEETLPGIPLSNVKLFFINFAQGLCEVNRAEEFSETHSSGRRRVNQVLRNFPPFSDAFRCSASKYMNSAKCGPLWQ